jgi:triosephosphate isomerase (TIM)
MRKKIVAGNWKMNNTYSDGLKLVSEITNMVADEVSGDALVIIAPPFVHLSSVGQMTAAYPRMRLAAQNCSSEVSGAFTGEVSVPMLRSVGVEYVITGHSERRLYFGETNGMLRKKVDLCLQHELVPIYCCGETLEQRNSSLHFDTVKTQLEESLFHLNDKQLAAVVIAYEPVWAIGTGLTATPQQAQEMHGFIRSVVEGAYGKAVAESVSILYGGSCNAKNAAELFAGPDVDGGLIGGASLKSRDFVDIVKALR